MAPRMKAALGLAVAVAAVAVGVKAARVLAGRHAALQRVAPELRSPVLYVLPNVFGEEPPRDRPWLTSLMRRAVVRAGALAQEFPGLDGNPPVHGFLYDALERQRPSGAVLWIHGGGMVSGLAAQNHPTVSRLTKERGILVATVDYRLAPRHPFPAALDDCMAVLHWLHDNAECLGIDPARIAVGGESAGGGLAAMVSQRALDEGLPVAFQVLLYPMLDDRTPLRDPGHRGEILWTPRHNKAAWEWFLGHPVGAGEDRPYASAARRADLTGLPPAWIGVGELDLFHDEDLEYARRLRETGVAVELVVVPGMSHALDMLLPASMRAFTQSWMDALARSLAEGRVSPATPTASRVPDAPGSDAPAR